MSRDCIYYTIVAHNLPSRESYADLLHDDEILPTSLRLGAYHQLAQLKQRTDHFETVAQLAVASVEWMAGAAESKDYQICAYYLEQMNGLWETLPPPAIADTTQTRWEKAHEQWNQRFEDDLFYATLQELLPTLQAWIAIFPAGEIRYAPIETAYGWNVPFGTHLADGKYLGGMLSLTAIEKLLLPRLNRRLRRLGEEAVGRLLKPAEIPPKRMLAVRRLASPLSPWQLAVEPTKKSSVARWQFLSLRWSISLCFGTILVGVYWAWKRIQREHELSGLKTDFVSNVSHELKTPLTSIRLFVETLRLKRYQSESEAEEYLDVLQHETERLTRLVDRVLDFPRMERGQKQFDFAEGDLKSVVSETVAVFQRRMSEGEDTCEIDLRISAELPSVSFDQDAISETLLNLLHNAVKYSHPPRQVSVKLERARETVIFAVQDNGIGIPKREQRRIFERFYRANDTLAREVEGSGLGLAMVKYIVEAHNGTVSVESKIGEGSTFSVSLPIKT